MTVRGGSPDTRRIYERDFAAFAAWCEENGVASLPARAEDVAGYLGERARTDRPATLARRVASIARAHEDQGLDSPTRSFAVRSLLRALRRQAGGGAAAAVAAPVPAPAWHAAVGPTATARDATGRVQAAVEDIAAMADAAGGAGGADTLAGKRDRAVILLTFAASLRRGELAALDRSQVGIDGEGLTLRLPARGREGGASPDELIRLTVPRRPGATHCPVAALEAWLEAAGIEAGPVFRPVTLAGRVQARSMTGHAIAEIIKRAAAAAGRDPRRFSVQSLRARPAAPAGAVPIAPVRLLEDAAVAADIESGEPSLTPLETAAEGVAVFDRAFRYRYVNGRFEGFTQRARAELLGRVFWDVFPAVADHPIAGVLRHAMEERRYVVYGYESQVQPGATLEVRGVPYGGSDAGGLIVFFREIGAAGASRGADAPLVSLGPAGGGSLGGTLAAADEGTEAARAVLDALPHVVWTTCPDGSLRSLNRQWFRYTGAPPWSPGQPPSVAGHVHPDDWPAVREAMRRGMTGEAPFEFRYRLRRSDGVFRRHLARLVPVRGADGALSHWLGTGTEVEEG